MKNGKCFRFIKNYPIIWGILGVCITVGILALYEVRQRSQVVDEKYINAEMERTATLENTNCPEVLMDNFLAGLKKQDLDKTLRCMGIEEKAEGSDVKNIINREGCFYTDLTVVPSGYFREYTDICSIEVTEMYSEELQKIWDVFPDPSKLRIVKTGIVSPKVQMEAEFQSKRSQQLEDWGGEYSLDMAALLEYEGENYILGVTLGHYWAHKGSYWKVLFLHSELAGTTEETPIRKISPEEYEGLDGDMSTQKFLKEAKKQNVEYDLYEEREEDVDAENGLFEVNYPVIHPLKADSPEKLIEAFFLGIEKKELASCIGYCTLMSKEELAETTPELIGRQRETARQVKKFCYGFMGCDYEKEHASLSEIGKTGTKIVAALNPQYFMYIDWSDMIPLEKSDSQMEYLVCFRYEGKHFMSGFILEDQDGWRIRSLSSDTLGLENGEVRELTDKEYEKILERYDL